MSYIFEMLKTAEEKATEILDRVEEAAKQNTGLCIRLVDGEIKDVWFCKPKVLFRLKVKDNEAVAELGSALAKSITFFRNFREMQEKFKRLLKNLAYVSILPPATEKPEQQVYEIIQDVFDIDTFMESHTQYPGYVTRGKINVDYEFSSGWGARTTWEFELRIAREVYTESPEEYPDYLRQFG